MDVDDLRLDWPRGGGEPAHEGYYDDLDETGEAVNPSTHSRDFVMRSFDICPREVIELRSRPKTLLWRESCTTPRP